MSVNSYRKYKKLPVFAACLLRTTKPVNIIPVWFVSQDSYPSVPRALNLSESCVTSGNFASTTEGIIESGPYKGETLHSPFVWLLSSFCLCAVSSLSDFCNGAAHQKCSSLVTLLECFAAFCVYKQSFSPSIHCAPLLGFNLCEIERQTFEFVKVDIQLNLMSSLWSPGVNAPFLFIILSLLQMQIKISPLSGELL